MSQATILHAAELYLMPYVAVAIRHDDALAMMVIIKRAMPFTLRHNSFDAGQRTLIFLFRQFTAR